MKLHDPITPGGILLTEFFEALEISQYRLAQATGLPQTRITKIVHGRRRITPDTDLRLLRALELPERCWINMQTDYDVENEDELHGTHEGGLQTYRRRACLVPQSARGSLANQ